MQFKITPEQGTVLGSCLKVHEAVNKTLQTALNHHSEVMIKNQDVSDEMWGDIQKEHGLDFNTHDWCFTQIGDDFYVISQDRQEQTDG